MRDEEWNACVDILCGFVLGTAAVGTFAAVLVGANGPDAGDWLQFGGTTLGAGVALGAAIYAWRGLKSQIDIQQRTVELLTEEQTQRATHMALRVHNCLKELEARRSQIESEVQRQDAPYLPGDLRKIPKKPTFNIENTIFSDEQLWRVEQIVIEALRKAVKACAAWNSNADIPQLPADALADLKKIEAPLARASLATWNSLNRLGYVHKAAPDAKFYNNSFFTRGGHSATSREPPAPNSDPGPD